MPKDIIIVVVILAIVIPGIVYIYKSKKSGQKCIGCPSGGKCCKCKHNSK